MLPTKLLNNKKYKILIDYSFTRNYLFYRIYNFKLIRHKDAWIIRDTIFTKYELYEVLTSIKKKDQMIFYKTSTFNKYIFYIEQYII